MATEQSWKMAMSSGATNMKAFLTLASLVISGLTIAKPTPNLNCAIDGTYASTYNGFEKIERISIPFDSFTIDGNTGEMRTKVVRDGIIEKADTLSVLVQQRLNDGDPMKFVYYRELPHWFAEGKEPWKIAIDSPKELQPIDGIEHIEVLTVRYEGYGKPYSFIYHDSNAFTHFGKCTD